MRDDLQLDEDEPPRSLDGIIAQGLIECFLEGPELVPFFVMLGSGILFAYLIGSGLYHLAFDPNAVDVAARLDALSIDPDKWLGRG